MQMKEAPPGERQEFMGVALLLISLPCDSYSFICATMPLVTNDYRAEIRDEIIFAGAACALASLASWQAWRKRGFRSTALWCGLVVMGLSALLALAGMNRALGRPLF
jgi:hypothetical protein